ncbi:extracellular solute-binding protein [Pseudokineococcus basanitobsidens]|uniref:Extracellular solute-binding protein n=1 Tax=Pseudokineococcus basanitobsidens TaxID=1926649 RepID=A0ABU8RFM0_9ACTN
MSRNPRSRARVAVGAAATSALLALSACGSSGDEATGGEAGGGDGVVTVWHYFTVDEQVAAMDTMKERFESEHDGVTVENVYVPYDQMNNKLISAAGAQTGPDVVLFNGGEAAALALGGALAPMDEQWGAYEDADQFPDSVLHEIDGSLYAVQGYVNLLGLWYNADILAEVGVEPPTTVDELEDAMAAAAQAGYEGLTASGLPQSQGEWQAYPWLSAEGFDYESPDAAPLEAGLARARDWVEQGWLSQEVTTWDQTVPFQEFTAGGVAFAENGNWQLGAAAADADFEYGVVPMPVGDQGSIYLGGEGQAIGAFADDPDLAWEYLQGTFLDPDAQVQLAQDVGYIPARADAGEDEAVTSDELLAPFAESVASLGATYPAPSIPPEAVADVQTTMGQAWSAALGGQQAPADAAEQALAAIEPALGG